MDWDSLANCAVLTVRKGCRCRRGANRPSLTVAAVTVATAWIVATAGKSAQRIVSGGISRRRKQHANGVG